MHCLAEYIVIWILCIRLFSACFEYPYQLLSTLVGAALDRLAKDSLHVLCTPISLSWPGRYGTYKMVQAAPGGTQHVAFTRILHRTEPDALMTEVSGFILFSFFLGGKIFSGFIL